VRTRASARDDRKHERGNSCPVRWIHTHGRDYPAARCSQARRACLMACPCSRNPFASIRAALATHLATTSTKFSLGRITT
jgi:hypothetical protein